MTPSATLPPTASARRARLLAASALCGVAAMLAQPALAGTLPAIPSAANITVSSGGSQPTISFPDAITLQIDLNAPRTVINWTDLHLSSGDALNFLFDAASDIVLNKTTSQIRFDTGSIVTGKVGAATAGNVWFYSPQGVIVSPGATMTAGGFLFSRGSTLNDVSFVGAADPLANLRAATDALIRMTTISSATTASINGAGDVVLSASSGALNVAIAEGATVDISTTLGSITASEVTATTGAASVAASGPGATVTQIVGATGVTVSSNSNTSVGSATTLTSGDILITSNGSASLTLGNSARDLTLSAPQVFVSTVDAGRDVFITGTTSAFVTNRIFAGDDIEITADGDVSAGGAYLKSTGAGATDDAHILLRSDTGFVNAGNTLLTQGTGTAAGDITIQAATTATLGTADSTRDIKVFGTTASLANGAAARDIVVTATNGTATVTTAATAGDDVIVQASGDIVAGGATLKGTGTGHVGAPGSMGGSYVYVASATGAVNVGSALTEGTGTAAGDVVISATTTATLGSGGASRDLKVFGTTSSLTSGSAARDLFVDASAGDATITTSATAGDDVEITAADGDVVASGATLRSTGVGATDDAHVLARSTTGAVNVGAAQTQGTGVAAGNATVGAATDAILGSGSSSRDLTVTASNAISLTGAYTATGTASFMSTAGSVSQASGSITAGTLTVSALSGVALTQAGNNVANLDVIDSGLGGFSYRDSDSFNLTDVIVSGADVSLTSISGAITQSAGPIIADTLSVTAATGISLNEDNSVTSLGVMNNTTSGGLSFRDIDNFDITDDISSAGNVSLFSTSGDITHSGGTLHAGGFFSLDASGLITVGDITADGGIGATAAGDIDVTSATAGGGVSLLSAGGHAILRKAVLTGSGASDNLTISAAGDAILGADDYLTITTDNVFTRTGGGTGTASVTSTSGDALIHLDTSAGFDTVSGEGVDVTVNTGSASFGTITATADDLYVEALDGSLTVGTATAANGDVDLNAFNSDLTLTGSAHGGGLVHLGAFGLLDGTSASLISSDGDLDLEGGVVDLGTLQADGVITASALDGNLDVQSAQAGVVIQFGASGDAFVDTAEAVQAVFVVAGGDALVNLVKVTDAAGFAIVHGDDDATVRAAEAPAGILVDAVNKATFGADDEASITAANYVVTDPGCGCGTDGLQVISTNGDALVYIDTASNGIGVVGASQTGDAIVVQKTGNLLIGEVAGYNVRLEASTGTLETGFTTVADGDYTITAQDFLGDALTPTLFNGLVRDVTITDTLGDLNLGTTALHADRQLTIVAQGGAVTGLGQLDAGSDIDVTADAIALDTVQAGRDLNMNAGNGLVDVATSVSVGRTYALIGGDFSAAALAPLGAKAGTWTILDQVGDFDFSGKTLHYGSSIAVNVMAGDVIGGDITSDAGTVFVQADGGSLGALYAGGGQVTAIGDVGGMAVGSAQGVTRATVTAVNGTASLGSAILTGPGIHGLTVRSTNGDAVLGAATVGAITAGNIVTSTGSSIALAVTAPTGKVDINLGHTTNAKLTTVSAANDVKIKVVNGAQAIGAVTSTNGAVTINGPTGLLTVDQLTAHSTSRINAIGDLRLVAADADAQLTLQSLAGGLRLGDGTPGRVIDVAGGLSLQAFTDIVQEQGALKADTLSVLARSDVTLLGDNLIPNLLAVTVSNGGFAYHGTGAFTLHDVVDVQHGTVDLRSGGTIGQNLAGLILAQKLTGSSVGAANFRAANEIVELGDFTNTGGLFKLVDNRALTIGGTVLSTGTLSIASHGGMTIAGTGTVRANGAGDAVVLASDGVFTNARGADAVTAASPGGRWLIYTQAFGDPLGSTAGNTFNGLSGKSYYGAAYNFAASGFTAGINNGNRFVYAYQPTITVTPDSKIMTYDGTIPSLSATVTGLVNGDLFTDAWTGALVISGATSKNVGTYALTAVTGGLTSDLNYAFAAGTPGSLRIDPKALTATLAANDRTYDGTTAATGSIGLTGVLTGETVAAAGAYAFADKNAGTGKTVTATGVTLSGADAGNYTVASTTTDTADILKKDITGALAASDKTYDGTTAAAGSIGLTGVVTGDAISVSGTYAFADRNAGIGKTVTASGVAVSGGDAGNYTLTSLTTTDTADILKKDVTGALTAGNKTYDGTTAATGSISLTGVVTGDTVSASGTYAFADKNAGVGKTVMASSAVLAGADAGNYSLTGVSAALADILRRSVAVAADGGFKAFGQVEPTLTYRITAGALVAGDAFTGALGRDVGEIPGSYGITRGTLTLSANYDLSFTGAVFTIQPIPSNDQGGAPGLKHLNQSPDFNLDWDPETNLTTEGQAPQGGASGGGLTVAALR